MARYVGLIVVLCAWCGLAHCNVNKHYDTQAEAYAACIDEGVDEVKYGVRYTRVCLSRSTYYSGYYAHDGEGAGCSGVGNWSNKNCGVDYHWSVPAPANCEAGVNSTVWVHGEYGALGPDYSNAPGTLCKCAFVAIASWSDGTYVGNCVATGGRVDDAFGPGGSLSAPTDQPPCGGGSCYDAASNQFCMVDDSGEQTCVAGPSPSGADAGKTPQACGVFNGKTICVGTPDAPKPNADPEPPLVDHQEVQTSDGQGAPPSMTVVNVYDTNFQGNNRDPGDGSTHTGSLGNGGNNGSEGKGDENGKCQDGSTPSASGCGAGYADRGCDQPPTCSGDPLICAALREQHATRCSADKRYAEVSDAGAAGQTLDGMGMVGPEGTGIPGRSDVFDEVSLGGDDGQGSGMDDSGWGWSRSCPIESKEFTLMGQGVTIDYGQACGALSLGGVLVMLMAYLAAARIVVMGSN